MIILGGHNYRQELKYYINAADRAELLSRLNYITQPDENADKSGRYIVRSLYFDNYADMAVTDKLSGLSRREKFRLRYYNGDVSFIRLEKKIKINKGCYKQTETLTKEQCSNILNGNYECLKEKGSPLAVELYVKIRFLHLRPKIIVDYIREAYTYKAGNVRVTIDSQVKSSNNTAGFLNPDIPTIPAANAMILEIKYDGFLPDTVRDIVQLKNRQSTEFSKYVVSRLV